MMVSLELLGTPVLQHIILAYIALIASILLGIPLAILSLYSRSLQKVVMVMANLMQAVPTFAVVAFVVPLIGIGFWPAIIAILLRALLPIIKNTWVGLSSLDPALIASAEGIGLSQWEIIRYVRLPNAYPAIFAGVKFAAILANSVAILTAMIGSGGLGTVVFEGLAGVNMMKMMSGALPAIGIALFLDTSFGWLEKRMVPPGMK
ncbi:glycine/betaine ABC transporter permease [Methanocalculus chunghsingensis]|uniref:Glycine/betaine ABC transporter permease n=2 Tax=Methanocalculus chunghsingensis TaxID=156457 RepID=A0A8J8B6R5_9EURY|nr:glycine/betaine ABC transporter permease [Methanocalculus chunghsingensis]